MSTSERVTELGLMDVLAEADVLGTFRSLPPLHQENFVRWIGKASADESHWRRIEALILALRMGPLQIDTPEPSFSAQAQFD